MEAMEIQITTLSENTANLGFIGEWGLSILVEVEGIKILVDTGLSFSAVYNAQLLGVDLTKVDYLVLSHGHTDHTGGLREFLSRKRGKVKVIAHPDIWEAKYVQPVPGVMRHAGIPFSREELESLGADFTFSSQPVQIIEKVLTTGEVPFTTPYEEIEANLFVKKEREVLPDKLADDLALVIDADFGLVVILGCAHRGIVNTLRQAQKLTGKEKVYAVMGGTHLYLASLERITKTAADLKTMGIQKIGVSHCTGFQASSHLAQALGEAFFLNHAGTRLKLPA